MNEDEPQDIKAVLEYYGFVDVPESFGWASIRCDFHGESRASASVCTARGAFTCHVCDIKGDAIGVIMKKEGLPFVDSLRKYEEITGGRRGVISQPATGKSRRGVSRRTRTHYENDGLFPDWMGR